MVILSAIALTFTLLLLSGVLAIFAAVVTVSGPLLEIIGTITPKPGQPLPTLDELIDFVCITFRYLNLAQY